MKLSLIALLIMSSAFAAKLGGVTYPDSTTYAKKKLVLNGLGIREATWLKIDVYVAALYLEKKNSSDKGIISSTETKRLYMKFVRDVEKKKVVGAYKESFDAILGNKKGAQAKNINAFLAKMVDMKDGKSMSLGFSGNKTELYFNGKLSATFEGADFQKTLLTIWFGNSPPNKGLKRGLLGK